MCTLSRGVTLILSACAPRRLLAQTGGGLLCMALRLHVGEFVQGPGRVSVPCVSRVCRVSETMCAQDTDGGLVGVKMRTTYLSVQGAGGNTRPLARARIGDRKSHRTPS